MEYIQNELNYFSHANKQTEKIETFFDWMLSIFEWNSISSGRILPSFFNVSVLVRMIFSTNCSEAHTLIVCDNNKDKREEIVVFSFQIINTKRTRFDKCEQMRLRERKWTRERPTDRLKYTSIRMSNIHCVPTSTFFDTLCQTQSACYLTLSCVVEQKQKQSESICCLSTFKTIFDPQLFEIN